MFKCNFLSKKLVFLENVVSDRSIQPDPNNVEAVKSIPAPLDNTQLCSLLGMVTYVIRLIPNFAAIAAPLSELLKDGQHFV